METEPRQDRRAKITPQQREEIVRRRAAGERLAALAAEFGISRQRVDVIAKRQKPPTRRRPGRQVLNEEQITWLESRLKASRRVWKLAAVEKAVQERFGIHMDTAAHLTWLVGLGVRIADYDADMPLGADFEAYLRSEEAQKLREREAAWKSRLPATRPRRGRPPKKPPPAGAGGQEKPGDLHQQTEEDGSLSLEEMLASVERHRRPPGMEAKPPPRFTPHGIRTGKHAAGQQPVRKKKRKKRR